jgi:hypothetical protein
LQRGGDSSDYSSSDSDRSGGRGSIGAPDTSSTTGVLYESKLRDMLDKFYEEGMENDEVRLYWQGKSDEEEAYRLSTMNAFYLIFQDFYKDQINTMVNSFDIELVLYDETEYFREYSEAQFNYPFTPRKTKIKTFKFLIHDNEDYMFHSTSIKFRRSSACLEGGFMDQMDFFKTLYEVAYNVIDQKIYQLKTEEEKLQEEQDKLEEDLDEANCGTQFF